MFSRLFGEASRRVAPALISLVALSAHGAPTFVVREAFPSYVIQVVPSPDLVADGQSVLRVEFTGRERLGSITESSVYTPNWTTAFTAPNPIVGGQSTGLWAGVSNAVFAAFESRPLTSAAPIDFLTLKFAPGLEGVDFDFSMKVTQDGQVFTGVTGAIDALFSGPADINADGATDLLDFDILGRNFGRTAAAYWQGDLNRDGTIGLTDLDIMGANLAANGVVALAVPEPAALAGFALMLALALHRR